MAGRVEPGVFATTCCVGGRSIVLGPVGWSEYPEGSGNWRSSLLPQGPDGCVRLYVDRVRLPPESDTPWRWTVVLYDGYVSLDRGLEDSFELAVAVALYAGECWLASVGLLGDGEVAGV